MKLLIALGNPGEEYKKTRHNAGMIVVNAMGHLNGFVVHMSSEYMNNSGSFVRKVLKTSNSNPSDLVIVHDDWAFEVGDFRVQFGRGANGHNGVKSVIDAIGTNRFWRVRVGIGSSPPSVDGEKYVLQSFSDSDYEELQFVANSIKKLLLTTPLVTPIQQKGDA